MGARISGVRPPDQSVLYLWGQKLRKGQPEVNLSRNVL